MRKPRTVSPQGRELIAVLGWLLLTVIYLEWLYQSKSGAYLLSRRWEEWLWRGLALVYVLILTKIGFKPENDAIVEKNRNLNAIASLLVGAAAIVFILVGVSALGLAIIAAALSSSLNLWSVAGGAFLLLVFFWLVIQMARARVG